MKKTVLFILIISLAGAACTAQPEELPKLMAEGAFSEELYQALAADWAAYDALSREEQMFSSHLPGYCTREFDDWTAVEQFVGMEIRNPLEAADDLEKGTYLGMPLGYANASRFYVTWYGTQDGHVEWVLIDSGYRSGELRVCESAALYSDPSESKSFEKDWSVEHRRLAWLEARDGNEPVISEDSGEHYEARTATLARGAVLYSIRVIGELGTGELLRDTLAEIVPYFEEIRAS